MDSVTRSCAVLVVLREARDPLTVAEVRARVEDRLAEAVSYRTVSRALNALHLAAPRLGLVFERHGPALAPSRAPRFRIRCLG